MSQRLWSFPSAVNSYWLWQLVLLSKKQAKAIRSITNRRSDCISKSGELHAARNLLKSWITSINCLPNACQKDGFRPSEIRKVVHCGLKK
ncbi:hypothetical protein IQ274_13445 [Nostoc sp. LEGE 12447]|uniref:hypothetical protein n=1 Tax=Nostoc sp. LEGE 12447 TaxID=1828640 RepID=UPI0018841288|nr:hypothetical protein [Nostoc sp. LEGE 12447]MBE8999192.1 hypothetical protein [Nostoc sp. LEGE 12447]